MGRPDLKPCPRQCMVWPNAIYQRVENVENFQKKNPKTRKVKKMLHVYHFEN